MTSAFIPSIPVLRSSRLSLSRSTHTPVFTARPQHARPAPSIRPPTMSAAGGKATPEPAPDAPISTANLPRSYVIWRWRIFFTMLFSYATYYVTRFSFPFSAPAMQTAMGLSLEQVGLISSCFPAVYGVSKLFGGMVADLGSPRKILALGLAMAAVFNVLFTFGNSVPYFALFWALNGAASSVGFPSCARLLYTWYSPAERGTYWGTLNLSLNIGGALSPILIGAAVSALGWRFGMYVPAAMAVVMAILAYAGVADSPKQAGLPPTPELPYEVAPKKKTDDSGNKRGAVTVFREQLVDGVLSEPAVSSLAASYFFVYVIRQALTSWTIFYLMQARGVATLVEAGVRVSGLELGGLVGSITSGWLSDKFITNNPNKGAIGQRVKVILIYVALIAIALTGFFYMPVTKALLPVQWLLFALTGAGLYGPQLLVGLAGAELVDRRYAGTSNGFLGLTSYTGAALAGFPMTLIVKKLGWTSFYAVIMGCCGVIFLLLAPLLGKRSFEQEEARQKAQSAQ